MGQLQPETVVLDGERMARALIRISHEIVEQHPDQRLALVGIHTRGAILASRLRPLVADISGTDVPLGEVDISLYRDDVATRAAAPVVHSTNLDFDIAGTTVIVVDDVLFTGRTVRAAIDAIFDFGRPRSIRLAVLCDRGHRELPIRPDHVGKNIPTAFDDRVNVRLVETDGEDLISVSHSGAVST
ncbi:MAG: bifunctional pyr operon transcriptional regulator/uracil phosphoribosyltransferase PyrR [Actinomycetes bacterium]